MSTKLYVGNLPFQTTEDELFDLFREFGPVVEAHVVMDKFTQRSRGFAFVTMESAEDAKKAVDKLEGSNFNGRPLKVNEARPREERPPRSGGGGGGGGGYRDRGDRGGDRGDRGDRGRGDRY